MGEAAKKYAVWLLVSAYFDHKQLISYTKQDLNQLECLVIRANDLANWSFLNLSENFQTYLYCRTDGVILSKLMYT